MAITIRDCLKLQSLSIATVVAGAGGLDKPVESVSVLEWINLNQLQKEFFIQNEILISSFYALKDDVNAQVTAIKKLYAMGEVGLILYYVGEILPEIDSKVLDVADALQFPLIKMPEDQMKSRYSEVIMEITESIFLERAKDHQNFKNAIIDSLSRVPAGMRNVETILRVISDKLKVSLVLTDDAYQEYIVATWPVALNIDIHKLALTSEKGISNESGYYICGKRTLKKSKWSKPHLLFVLPVGMTIPKEDIEDVTEIVSWTADMWHISEAENDKLDFMISLINNDFMRYAKLSKTLNFPVEHIQYMLMMIFEKNGDLAHEIREMKEIIRKSLSDIHHQYIDAAIDHHFLVLARARSEEILKGVDAYDFGAYLSEKLSHWHHYAGVLIQEKLKAEEISQYFFFAGENIDFLKKIFLQRRIFYKEDLSLLKECMAIMAQGKEAVEAHIALLEPLMGKAYKIDLIHTLGVLVLDADLSVERTAEILFVHKNSVKYRLQKMKDLLGPNFMKFPQILNIYKALVLLRMSR